MSASLVVLPRFPGERTGTGQRSLLLIEGAGAEGPVHVVLLDGAARTPPPEALPGVETITTLFSEMITPRRPLARRLGGALRLIAPARAYGVDPALRATLLDLIGKHGIETVIFRYTALFCAAGITAADGLRVLVDVDDRDDQKYQTRLSRLFGHRLGGVIGTPLRTRLAGALKARLSAATHVWFATEEDIWPLDPARVDLLPNVPYWPQAMSMPAPSTAPQTILFVGIFGHVPNRDGVRWFLDQCWSQVRARCPEARLRIVGRGAWADMVREYAEADGVDFVGEVADLAQEYAAARLAICPVREGGGSKIKVIEAASFGRPVVATSHSLRGFVGAGVAAAGQADDPNGFAAACADILSDPDRADSDGARLRDWQTAHYSRAAFVASVAEAMRA